MRSGNCNQKGTLKAPRDTCAQADSRRCLIGAQQGTQTHCWPQTSGWLADQDSAPAQSRFRAIDQTFASSRAPDTRLT